MSKKFFHELSNKEYESLFGSKRTWEDLMEEYQQPEWCNYPDALEGIMGCWSLVYGKVKSKADCIGCELNKDA